MKAYRIKQWNLWYESAETRKLKTLTYYGKPNKLVGEGIGFTLAQPDNVALLGTWCLLEALASTSVRELRGWLMRNGTALTAARMAALTRVEEKHFTRALAHFCLPEVDWLEFSDVPGETPDLIPPEPPKPPAAGKVPGETPGNLPPTAAGEREVGREGTLEGGNQEVGSGLPGASHLPDLKTVQDWCATSGVPLDYARAKIKLADERKDFAKAGWQNGWQDKLQRFWKTDRKTWGELSKKNAPPSGRPDGWQAGDQDWWWADTLESLRATLSGVVMSGNKKTAARLREIISLREKKS